MQLYYMDDSIVMEFEEQEFNTFIDMTGAREDFDRNGPDANVTLKLTSFFESLFMSTEDLFSDHYEDVLGFFESPELLDAEYRYEGNVVTMILKRNAFQTVKPFPSDNCKFDRYYNMPRVNKDSVYRRYPDLLLLNEHCRDCFVMYKVPAQAKALVTGLTNKRSFNEITDAAVGAECFLNAFDGLSGEKLKKAKRAFSAYSRELYNEFVSHKSYCLVKDLDTAMSCALAIGNAVVIKKSNNKYFVEGPCFCDSMTEFGILWPELAYDADEKLCAVVDGKLVPSHGKQ